MAATDSALVVGCYSVLIGSNGFVFRTYPDLKATVHRWGCVSCLATVRKHRTREDAVARIRQENAHYVQETGREGAIHMIRASLTPLQRALLAEGSVVDAPTPVTEIDDETREVSEVNESKEVDICTELNVQCPKYPSFDAHFFLPGRKLKESIVGARVRPEWRQIAEPRVRWVACVLEALYTDAGGEVGTVRANTLDQFNTFTKHIRRWIAAGGLASKKQLIAHFGLYKELNDLIACRQICVKAPVRQ
jgi:hypothetical protein